MNDVFSTYIYKYEKNSRNSLVGQGLGLGAFTVVAQVRSLVTGELRSFKLHRIAKKKDSIDIMLFLIFFIFIFCLAAQDLSSLTRD